MLLLVFTSILLSTLVEALQVIGGNTTVVQGGTAILPCKLIDATEPLNQISWRKKPQTENFFAIVPSGPKFVNGEDLRFQFIGNFSDNNGTMQLSNVTLADEGTFTCLFTLFPSGNVMTDVPLRVLVPPVTSLKDDRPTLGDKEVSLVTCVAAGSKPRAEVKWITDSLAGKVKATTDSTQHSNGTTTTVSSLVGVPTREISQHVVQCVINSSAMSKEEIRPFTMQIYFPPAEVSIIKRSQSSFECEADANPTANFTWSRHDQLWQPGATLQFESMTADLNGIYQCQASNLYGAKHGYLYVHVHAYVPGHCSACWTLLVLLLLIVAGVVAYNFYKSGMFLRRGERNMVPTTSNTPEEAQRVEVNAEEQETEGRL